MELLEPRVALPGTGLGNAESLALAYATDLTDIR